MASSPLPSAASSRPPLYQHQQQQQQQQHAAPATERPQLASLDLDAARRPRRTAPGAGIEQTGMRTAALPVGPGMAAGAARTTTVLWTTPKVVLAGRESDQESDRPFSSPPFPKSATFSMAEAQSRSPSSSSLPATPVLPQKLFDTTMGSTMDTTASGSSSASPAGGSGGGAAMAPPAAIPITIPVIAPVFPAVQAVQAIAPLIQAEPVFAAAWTPQPHAPSSTSATASGSGGSGGWGGGWGGGHRSAPMARTAGAGMASPGAGASAPPQSAGKSFEYMFARIMAGATPLKMPTTKKPEYTTINGGDGVETKEKKDEGEEGNDVEEAVNTVAAPAPPPRTLLKVSELRPAEETMSSVSTAAAAAAAKVAAIAATTVVATAVATTTQAAGAAAMSTGEIAHTSHVSPARRAQTETPISSNSSSSAVHAGAESKHAADEGGDVEEMAAAAVDATATATPTMESPPSRRMTSAGASPPAHPPHSPRAALPHATASPALSGLASGTASSIESKKRACDDRSPARQDGRRIYESCEEPFDPDWRSQSGAAQLTPKRLFAATKTSKKTPTTSASSASASSSSSSTTKKALSPPPPPAPIIPVAAVELQEGRFALVGSAGRPTVEGDRAGTPTWPTPKRTRRSISDEIEEGGQGSVAAPTLESKLNKAEAAATAVDVVTASGGAPAAAVEGREGATATCSLSTSSSSSPTPASSLPLPVIVSETKSKGDTNGESKNPRDEINESNDASVVSDGSETMDTNASAENLDVSHVSDEELSECDGAVSSPPALALSSVSAASPPSATSTKESTTTGHHVVTVVIGNMAVAEAPVFENKAAPWGGRFTETTATVTTAVETSADVVEELAEVEEEVKEVVAAGEPTLEEAMAIADAILTQSWDEDEAAAAATAGGVAGVAAAEEQESVCPDEVGAVGGEKEVGEEEDRTKVAEKVDVDVEGASVNKWGHLKQVVDADEAALCAAGTCGGNCVCSGQPACRVDESDEAAEQAEVVLEAAVMAEKAAAGAASAMDAVKDETSGSVVGGRKPVAKNLLRMFEMECGGEGVDLDAFAAGTETKNGAVEGVVPHAFTAEATAFAGGNDSPVVQSFDHEGQEGQEGEEYTQHKYYDDNDDYQEHREEHGVDEYDEEEAPLKASPLPPAAPSSSSVTAAVHDSASPVHDESFEVSSDSFEDDDDNTLDTLDHHHDAGLVDNDGGDGIGNDDEDAAWVAYASPPVAAQPVHGHPHVGEVGEQTMQSTPVVNIAAVTTGPASAGGGSIGSIGKKAGGLIATVITSTPVLPPSEMATAGSVLFGAGGKLGGVPGGGMDRGAPSKAQVYVSRVGGRGREGGNDGGGDTAEARENAALLRVHGGDAAGSEYGEFTVKRQIAYPTSPPKIHRSSSSRGDGRGAPVSPILRNSLECSVIHLSLDHSVQEVAGVGEGAEGGMEGGDGRGAGHLRLSGMSNFFSSPARQQQHQRRASEQTLDLSESPTVLYASPDAPDSPEAPPPPPPDSPPPAYSLDERELYSVREVWEEGGVAQYDGRQGRHGRHDRDERFDGGPVRATGRYEDMSGGMSSEGDVGRGGATALAGGGGARGLRGSSKHRRSEGEARSKHGRRPGWMGRSGSDVREVSGDGPPNHYGLRESWGNAVAMVEEWEEEVRRG